jgi:hypothetical protein
MLAYLISPNGSICVSFVLSNNIEITKMAQKTTIGIRKP